MSNKTHGHYVEPEALLALANSIRHVDKSKTLALMDIQPNSKIIDIGCGPATDTIAFATMIEDSGEVVGVDYDSQMVEIANEKVKEQGLENRLKSIQLDLTEPNRLPFPDNYFDISHADRVLFHNQHPEYILQEMIRVTKIGGKVIIKGEDVSSWSWSPFSLEQDYFVKKQMAQTMDSWDVSKQSLKLFKHNKLTDISLDIVPVVNTKFYGEQTMMKHFLRFGINQQEAQPLIELAIQYDKENAYYDCMNVIIVSGIKQ